MRFYTNQHKYYCGIDLHSRMMHVCIIDENGEKLLHRNMRNDRAYFLKLLEPYRDRLIVGAESTYNWYWLADLCASEGIEFILGHAFYMKSIHGAKTKNDRVDSEKLARLIRAGMFPQAYVYPAAMRDTRDLLRRRTSFVRQRAALYTHIQHLNSQQLLPAIGVGARYKRNRPTLPEHFPTDEIRLSVAADIELIGHYDTVIAKLEKYIYQRAKDHDKKAFKLLQTVDGIGEILALTILYEVHTIERFPRVNEFISYCRLVKPTHSSAGKPVGLGNDRIGNPYLKWAFSEAAVCGAKNSKVISRLGQRLEAKHGKSKGKTLLAQKIARTVYFMLSRGTCFDEQRYLAA